MQAEEIFARLREKFGDGVVEEVLENRDPYVKVKAESLPAIAAYLRDDPDLRFDYLSLITSIDEGETLAAVYSLDSTTKKHQVLVRVSVPRQDPRVPTVENIWRAADWHEREAFDLMGIIFEGHHNLVRILCAEDWEGHPLRKDYEIPMEYHGIQNIVEPYH